MALAGFAIGVAAVNGAPAAVPAKAPPRLAIAEREVRRIGGCLARARPQRARALLQRQIGSIEAMRSMVAFRSDAPTRCVESAAVDPLGRATITFSETLIRGAAAEELINTELQHRTLPAPDPNARLLLARIVGEPAPGKTPKNRHALLALQAFAGCVARANPAGAQTLAGTLPVSDAESAALRALRPAMSGCLYDGQSAALNADQVRAAITEALYHVLAADAGPAAQESH